MLFWWLIAGWKMKLAIALWLVVGIGAWWQRQFIVRRGRVAVICSIFGFCALTLALSTRLAFRFADYRRVVSDPGMVYEQGEPAAPASRDQELIDCGPDDWPWWRGPTRDNHSHSEHAPLQWAPDDVLWKVEVPGRGHSSPILCGKHVFLTTADEGAQSQLLLAYDRERGDPLWSKIIHRGQFPSHHSKNSYASSTPACDGRHVYTLFSVDGSVYLTAVDFSGETVWQQNVGEYSSVYGFCSSPVVFRSLVIVTLEGLTSRRITAFDRKSGVRRWRSTFIEPIPNNCSPAIGERDGTGILVVPGPFAIQGFNPSNGKRDWSVGWPVNSASNTATVAGRRVFASATVPENRLVCIELDDSGAHELWQTSSGVPKVPSPLVVDDLLFVVTDNGVMECLDAATGKRLGRRRLGGDFSSSPLYAAGRIYAASEEGIVFAVSADPKLEILARNDTGEPIFATPVIAAGRMYVRTTTSLWCIPSTVSASE